MAVSEALDPERNDDDAALLVASLTDPSAFATFYRRNLDTVLGFFYRRTGCAQTSADLAAETFAQALASLPRYRPERGPATAWLIGIARNQLRHYLRRRRTAHAARVRLGLPARVELHDDEQHAIEDRFDAELRREPLAEAWAQLSPSMAQAVRLRVVEGLAYREVAARLGCSEGAARVRVSRGLSRLADAMGAP